MNLRTRVALAGGAAMIVASTLVGAVEYPAIGAGLRTQLDASLVDAVRQSPDSYEDIRDKVLNSTTGGSQTFRGGPEAGGGAGSPGGAGTLQCDDCAGKSVSPSTGDPLQGFVLTVGTAMLQLVPAPTVGPSAKFTDISAHDVDVAAGRAAPYFQDVVFDGKLYRVYTARMPGYDNTVIRAAKLGSDPAPTLRRLLWLLVILTPAAGLLAALIARLLAGRVLRPVGALTAAVEHITSTGDLATRVAVGGRDEVSRLAKAFSAMTTALDGSVGAQRRLVADASHELRTPITSLVTNLELLAEDPADPAARELIGEALARAQELTILMNDLIDLARFGEAPAHTEDVRLDTVAAQVAERRGVTFAVEDPVLVHGDPDALDRAVANLIDNALKFTAVTRTAPAAGTATRGPAETPTGAADPPPVLVAVRSHDASAIVEVRDRGPGIPAADLPYVFDRFHRSPTARSLPGSGLGLAIVKQIAEAHGGCVEAVPVPAGALVRITLPVVTPLPAERDSPVRPG